LSLHHRICKSTCYVNGLEDILEWRDVLLYFSFSLFRLFAENDNEGVILREDGEFL